MKWLAPLVAAILVAPPAAALGWSLHHSPPVKHPVKIDWYYGPRQKFNTRTEGIVVFCQVKTNSRAFYAQIHAKAGDLLIQTCRAVKKRPAGP